MTCSRCKDAERIPGQRWCRPCLTIYQRERRARKATPDDSAPVVADPPKPAVACTAPQPNPDAAWMIHLNRCVNGV
jgi:hypothetical protein